MSKIEVNTIDTQCGSALQIGCTNTATIGLGKSGDTITIPCGATIVNSGTQTGFGRTGTVDWVTTPKVTGDSPITAVTGEGYFLNTTAGTITVNLPAGAAGSIVSMVDYAGTWQTNNVTVSPNGSEKIGGTAADATLSTEGQSVTFVYVDSTQGWLNTMDSTSNVRGTPPYIIATGGTPCAGATCGDYKIHTFTGPGTLAVTNAGTPAGSTKIDYMVVAGGGSGGGMVDAAGGGGAGGYRESKQPGGPWSASPLATCVSITASVTDYPITVGGGGSANPCSAYNTPQNKGSDSIFSTITSTGGGDGGIGDGLGPSNPRATNANGSPGGSGGGGGTYSTPPTPTGQGTVGTGNTPVVSPVQGTNGGLGHTDNASYRVGGGGGGAAAVGGAASASVGGNGGPGTTSSIDATPTARAGGGGGGGHAGASPGGGGCGGAGGGGNGGSPPATNATAGTVNTGGGGGGKRASPTSPAGAGGSGIVVIRYK